MKLSFTKLTICLVVWISTCLAQTVVEPNDVSRYDLSDGGCLNVSFDSRDFIGTWEDEYRDTRQFSIAFRKGFKNGACKFGGFSVDITSMMFSATSPDTGCRNGNINIRGAKDESLLKHCPITGGTRSTSWIPDSMLHTLTSTARLHMSFSVPQAMLALDEYVTFEGQVCATCTTDVELQKDILVVIGGAEAPKGNGIITSDVVEVLDMSDAQTGCNSPSIATGFPGHIKNSAAGTAGVVPVLAGGETDAAGTRVNRIYKYTGAVAGWTVIEDVFAAAFTSSGTVQVDGNSFMVTGGHGDGGQLKTTYRLEGVGATVTVTSSSDLAQKFSQHCSVALDDTTFFINGGSFKSTRIWSGPISDPASITQFVQELTMSGRDRGMCGIVTVPSTGEKELVITGGVSGGNAIDSTDIYNFGSGSWRTGPVLPRGLGGAASVQTDDSFMVVGGWEPSSSSSNLVSDEIYLFNPAGGADNLGSWDLQSQTLTRPRFFHSAFMTTRAVAGCA